MGPGRYRQRVEAGELPALISLRHSDPYLVETVGQLGFDGVVIDMQHGPIGYEAMYVMLASLAGSQSTPFVRLPANEPATAMKALDAGAYGIVCPGIRTAAEASEFVRACRYPPFGYRSLGPNRAGLTPGYTESANVSVLTFAAIDTDDGYTNLEQILAVDQLDGVLLEGTRQAVLSNVERAARSNRSVLAAVETSPIEDDDVLPPCGVVVRDDVIYRVAFERAVARLSEAAAGGKK